MANKVLDNIFSVRNTIFEDSWAKVVKILGMKFYIKKTIPKYVRFRKLYSGNSVEKIIYDAIKSNKPFSLIRVGNSELCAINEYIMDSRKEKVHYSDDVMHMMKYNAGFFSADDEQLSVFAQEALNCVKRADYLALLWLRGREYRTVCKSKAKFLYYNNLVDFFSKEHCWLSALENKKVLIIHPFEQSILTQIPKLDKIFKTKDFWPNCEIKVLKAIQGIDSKTIEKYKTWWNALDCMYKELEQIDFDVALIGAGAFGIFLADKCKLMGKQAIQLCGATQLLFGIKGERWDNCGFYNENWIRPLDEDKISNLENFAKGEGGIAYW